jgi:PAS domain S-box-containing protein
MSAVSRTESSVLVDILFEDPVIGRCLVAPDGTVLRANREWLRSTGLTADEVLGADLIDLFPDTRDMALAIHARARAGHAVEVPRHALRIRGRETWWEGSVTPVPMHDGVGLLVSARQIAPPTAEEGVDVERRRVEDALHESEAKYRTLFDSIDEGFCIVEVLFDGSGKPTDYLFVEVNKSFERQTGLLGATGRRIRELAPSHEEHWFEIYGRVALTGAPIRFENSAAALGRYYDVYAFRVGDPAHRRVAILFKDVMERHRAEVALRESEATLDAFFASSPGILNLTDAEVRYVKTDAMTPTYFGLTRETIVGKSVAELAPEFVEKYGAMMKRVIATRQPVNMEVQSPVASRPGEIVYWRASYFPVPIGGGKVGLGVMGIDITDLKKAEAALVEEDRRKSEFLGVLSHELRNPLAPIRNSIHVLERAAPGSEQATRAKEVVRRQTEHLTRLVDDLLDITRISRGKVALERARVDLRDVVRRTTDDLLSVFAKAGVELHVDYGTLGPVWIDADATRIAQVVGNLLQNSVKFTPTGGSVAVSVAGEEGRAEVRVRDDGIGMDPATVERMFEPFAQADQSLARTQGGLGLGLALVKGVIELHGGTVEARSEGLGRGAEFVVQLPLVPAPAAAKAPVATEQRGSALSILIVEDNEDAAATLADLLVMGGNEVNTVCTGSAGVSAIAASPPDVLICDIGLPDMDGYDVIRAVRVQQPGRRVFAIALTGYAQPQDREAALAAGFDAHLPKPPPLEELEALIRSVARLKGEGGR